MSSGEEMYLRRIDITLDKVLECQKQLLIYQKGILEQLAYQSKTMHDIATNSVANKGD